jgi:Putative adhesin
MSTDLTARTPTDAGARRTDPALRGALRLLAVVLSILMVAFGAWSLMSLLARSTQHRQATYAGVRSVDVDLSFESLRVTATDTPTVHLDRSWSWSFGEPAVRQRRVGDRLVVTSSGCGFTPGLGCTGSVELEVPRDMTLRLRTSNSGLTLQDLTGDIDASTSNGSVAGSGLTGRLRLHTSNGRVEATGLRTTRVDATTSNGGVRLGFTIAPTTVVASTSNGSVEVLVPRDGTTYRVDATTSNGANEVTVPTDPRTDRTIDAHTSNGAVRVLDRP